MADILRVSIVGSLPGGEEWSINPVWAIGGDFGVSVTPSQAQAIADAMAAATIPANFLLMLSTSTAVTGYRVEARTLTGALETQAEAAKTSGGTGTGASAHPYQTSAVVSLRTDRVGPSGRGRLYVPATGVTIASSDLRISTSLTATYLGGVKSYLTALQTAIDATLDGISLVVWSRKTASTNNVKTMMMGNVTDTQRRRRDALLEAYSSVTYP